MEKKKFKFTIEKKEGINEWSIYMKGIIYGENSGECAEKLTKICTCLSNQEDKLFYTCEEEGGQQ